MKFECPLPALRDACSALISAVPARSPKTELTCFFIWAQDGTLVIRASDYEVFMEYRLAVPHMERSGKYLVPAQKFLAILKAVESPTISFDGDPADERQLLKIRADRDVFRLVVQDAENFPNFPESVGVQVTLPAEQMERMVRQTEFATAAESSKYSLNGILFHFDAGFIKLVATDGKRLAVASFASSSPERVHQIVPKKALAHLQKLLSGVSELSVRVGEFDIFFETPQARLFSRLIEGNFPEYRGVVPEKLSHKILIKREDFMQVLRKAQLFTTPQSSVVRFRFADRQLILSSQAAEYGDSIIVLDIDYSGPSIEIGFNPDFVMAAAKVISGENVYFEVEGPGKPGLIRSVEDNYLNVVMPMKL